MSLHARRLILETAGYDVITSVSVTISPIYDAHAAVTGASTIARDLTQAKMAEQALRNSEKLAVAERLAATVAHEINGPREAVATILFLLDRAELSHTAHEFVHVAQEEVKRIGQITKRTLGFHREGERGEAELRASDLIDGKVVPMLVLAGPAAFRRKTTNR